MRLTALPAPPPPTPPGHAPRAAAPLPRCALPPPPPLDPRPAPDRAARPVARHGPRHRDAVSPFGALHAQVRRVAFLPPPSHALAPAALAHHPLPGPPAAPPPAQARRPASLPRPSHAMAPADLDQARLQRRPFEQFLGVVLRQ